MDYYDHQSETELYCHHPQSLLTHHHGDLLESRVITFQLLVHYFDHFADYYGEEWST